MAGTFANVMDVNIVAENRPVWSGKATSVVVPTPEGYMGILSDHEPILALVGEGDVKVTTDSQSEESFQVKGGFISFQENVLTIGVDKVL